MAQHDPAAHHSGRLSCMKSRSCQLRVDGGGRSEMSYFPTKFVWLAAQIHCPFI